MKKRLDQTKSGWSKEFIGVLCYGDMTQLCNMRPKETFFKLVYKYDGIMQVELTFASIKVRLTSESTSNKNIKAQLNLIEETRELAHITKYAVILKEVNEFNTNVKHRNVKERDLVLRKTDEVRKEKQLGNMTTSLEESYQIRYALGKKAY